MIKVTEAKIEMEGDAQTLFAEVAQALYHLIVAVSDVTNDTLEDTADGIISDLTGKIYIAIDAHEKKNAAE